MTPDLEQKVEQLRTLVNTSCELLGEIRKSARSAELVEACDVMERLNKKLMDYATATAKETIQ